MKECRTVDQEKPFYYEGDLDQGLVIQTSAGRAWTKKNIGINIPPETIDIIRSEIEKNKEVPMGACRDNPTPGSLGYMLLNRYRVSPQFLSYVIPLLVEDGFCEAFKDKRSIIVRKTIMLKLKCQRCGRYFEADHRRQVPYCHDCAAELRGKGQGPIQTKRRAIAETTSIECEQKLRQWEKDGYNVFYLREKWFGTADDQRNDNKRSAKALHDHPTNLTPTQFANVLSTWYEKYTKSPYFATYFELETELSQKAKNKGYLDLDDLSRIAIWGGNQHGINQRLIFNNSPAKVMKVTREAIRQIADPAVALRTILEGIDHWGLSYASKTLRCMCPEKYVALDQKLRNSIDSSLLRTIYDGDTKSMVYGYLIFLDLCQDIQDHIVAPGPRSGIWFPADIEMALFQFVWDGGQLIDESPSDSGQR